MPPGGDIPMTVLVTRILIPRIELLNIIKISNNNLLGVMLLQRVTMRWPDQDLISHLQLWGGATEPSVCLQCKAMERRKGGSLWWNCCRSIGVTRFYWRLPWNGLAFLAELALKKKHRRLWDIVTVYYDGFCGRDASMFTIDVAVIDDDDVFIGLSVCPN